MSCGFFSSSFLVGMVVAVAMVVRLGNFLAALSSSRSLVVGPLGGWLFSPSVRHVCEKMSFRVL